jgi:hypothetical protein
MAGIKKENKSRKSFTAENRFKNLAKNPLRKNFQTKKKIKTLNGFKSKFFNQVFEKNDLIFFKTNMEIFLAS